MKTMWGAFCTLHFLFLLQCCNAALKHGGLRRDSAAVDVHHGDPLAGRRKFGYLVQLQEWRRVTRMGISCPKPTACECHCDCPNTVATGQMPTAPPACPMYPSFPSPPPLPSTTAGKQAIMSAPSPKLPCKEGQVTLSDGTCKHIDMKMIKEIYRMVEVKRHLLTEVQGEYNSMHKPRKTPKYYNVRGRLIEAHTQYRAALGLFLNALATMRDMENDAALDPTGGKGKEFAPGKKTLRPHCEQWTVDGTAKADDELCAIVCRNQPGCVGFAKDPKFHWCIWFDDMKPDPKDLCSEKTETEYVKRWQAPINNKIWTAMEKIHVFDKAIVEALKLADSDADSTNKTFVGWWGFKGDNTTVKLNLKDHFMDKMGNYTGTILDTDAMRKQYLDLQETALKMVEKETLKNSALDELRNPKIARAEKLQKIAGFATPAEDPPNTLRWKDFPNSEDTAWSKIHPDCPMGTPCFCDCKCRKAPPQNFVEPPPPPTTPCPPPPLLPNPAQLSAILTR